MKKFLIKYNLEEVKALVRERELLENATLAEQTDGEVSE